MAGTYFGSMVLLKMDLPSASFPEVFVGVYRFFFVSLVLAYPEKKFVSERERERE